MDHEKADQLAFFQTALAGLPIVADDYCVIGPGDRPMAYSLYNTVKLKGNEDVRRFAELAPYISNPDRTADEKAMIFLHECFRDQIMVDMPIKALLILRIKGKPGTDFTPAPSIAAMKALAPAKRPSPSLSPVSMMLTKVKCFSIVVTYAQ